MNKDVITAIGQIIKYVLIAKTEGTHAVVSGIVRCI